MNCAVCGHFCSNEHLQCNEFNSFLKRCCSVCNATTQFKRMNLNSSNYTTPQPNVFCEEQPTYSDFPNQIFEGIETQSRLSKEHLSMKDSVEFNIQNAQGTDNNDQSHEALEIEKNCSKNEISMKTLFVGATPAENSVSFIGYLDHQDTGKSVNADAEELSKNENKSFDYSSRECKDGRKENIFLFKEDPNDFNVIQTSEIRFMESCDSLQNFFGTSKHQELATASSNNGDQMKSLSAKALRDFDSRNSVDSIEVVNNYLQTYSPTTISNPPAYNCTYEYCQFSGNTGKQKLEMAMKTVSVSTESHPSLKSTCLDRSEENLATKLKSHDYVVMQAVGVAPDEPGVSMSLDKNINKHGMDMRMQKILETFKEDVKVTNFTDKSHLIKIPTEIPAKEQEKEHVEKKNLKKEDKNSDLIAQLLNTHRGFYNPPNPLISPVNNLHLIPEPQPAQQDPPSPQYQTVPCSPALSQELLLKQTKFLNLKLVPACMLNIPRSPIQCPESTCRRIIFVSDFNKHLVVDHNHLPMERITPFQCKNFFLDTRLLHCGSSKCHLLYLMRDKIMDLGSSEYKDFLPILVMTTRISLNQMCGLRSKESTIEYFLIWVTGIALEEFPISVSLTVWSRSGRVPACHVVYSGQMYSIRNSQNALDVWQSGRMLLLSSQEIDALTCNGREMLNLQLSVH